MMEYKKEEDHPVQVEISTYWNAGFKSSILREGLPPYHHENLWNWFRRTYPDLNPAFYEIENPNYRLYKDKTKEELIDMIIELKTRIENYRYGE